MDNGRDIGNKIGTLVFKSGKTADDMTVVKTMDVDSKFAGWLTCFLADTDNHILAVDIKGRDQQLIFKKFSFQLGFIKFIRQLNLFSL